MDNYGMSMFGTLVVEKVPVKPDWGVADTGRIIFDMSTGTYWLGAHSASIGYGGWVSLGLTVNSVNDYNINWDTQLTGVYGGVNASDVPTLYLTAPSDVQHAIDDISLLISGLQSAVNIVPEAIKDYHLDVTGPYRITASDIPIDNTNGYFSGSIIKIEDALDQISRKTASDIRLNTTSGAFGNSLGFTPSDVQAALEDLETYVSEMTASQIPCTYEGCGCDTNLQFAIDALYHLHTNIKLTDLIDVADYDSNNRYLKSNGINNVTWVELVANDVKAQYPGVTNSNVQAALWNIGIVLDDLDNRLNALNFKAEDIEYTLGSYTFLNVDDALDYIMTTFYQPTNRPVATDISCSGIGLPSNNNVQLGLTYLNNQINSILSQMPCTVGASDVTYYSAQGSTDISHTLDYIMGFISYAILNTGITYPPFVV